MKILKIICLFVFSSVSSQSLEKNENIKRFSYVEIIRHSIAPTGWKTKLSLNNGKVWKEEAFFRNELRSSTIYIHDTILKITTEVKKYDINKGATNDTLKYIYTWDRANHLIQKEDEFGYKETYSNFNDQNLPQLIEKSNPRLDSLFDYREEYIYDDFGNIIHEKLFSKIEHQIEIEINTYKYDKYGNVVEVNRDSNPKQEYPITVTGGRFRYENEKYRYVYNKFGLWTERYWIVENREYLIAKRKFK